MKEMIERELVEITEKNLIPAWAMVELTYRCNLKCEHCYLPLADRATSDKRQGTRQEREISTKEVKKLLAELEKAGTLFLAFTGGEVFLRKDIFEILEEASKRHFAVTVFTNGVLLDQEKVQRLKELGVHEVSVSLYSLKATVHDSVTKVKGSWKKTMQGLKLLKAAKLKVKLKCPLMKKNNAERKALERFAKAEGFTILFDPVLAPGNDRSTKHLKFGLNEKALNNTVKEYCSGFKYSDKFLVRNVLCSAGKNFVSINPFGVVYPCLQLPLSCGKIKIKGFNYIWRNSKLLKKIRAWKLADVKVCSDCPDLIYCSRCPGLAFLESGNILGRSSSACKIAAARRVCA